MIIKCFLSYYIIPFKQFKSSLKDLYQLHPNISKNELYLNFTNEIILYTFLKINNSQIYQAILQSNEICSSFSDGDCLNEFNSDFKLPSNHINANLSEVFDKIYEKNNISFNNKKCINGIIGFGNSDYLVDPSCISFVEQVKKIDNTVKSYTWSIYYFNSSQKNGYNYDGYIIIGIEPHEYQPVIFKESNYRKLYSYEDSHDDYFYKKNSEYIIKYDSIYFYNNNNLSSDNLIKCEGPSSMDGFFRFNLGMIQSSLEYFYNIKKYFFNNYINSNICKEIIFSEFYHTFVCEKNKLDVDIFYNSFPTLYFKSIGLDFIFELNSEDLFKEENNNIYFMVFSNDLNSFKWGFGEIFLKKYFFTFNQENNLIGFYTNTNINGKDEKTINNDENKNKKSRTGMIILIIAICLLVIESILAGIWIWNKKFSKNRKKRANELKDDNYEYMAENTDNNKIINDN